MSCLTTITDQTSAEVLLIRRNIHLGMLNCSALATHTVYDAAHGCPRKSISTSIAKDGGGGAGVVYHPFENQVY